MKETTGYFLLDGSVQHYDWGGYNYIPGLLGIQNPNQQPFAELWMGTHPRGPALVVVNGKKHYLKELVDGNPAIWLGKETAKRFSNDLPFLFKILDVRKMLSIQAHPNKVEAEEGFARENALEIPIDSPQRVFRDDNHKPEAMVALSEFYLLHGFRDINAIEKTLHTHPAFETLQDHFADKNIQSLYGHIMNLPQKKVNTLLVPLLQILVEKNREKPFSRDEPEYWALQAFHDHTSPNGDLDRGIFSIFLLNLVRLEQGEGIFQKAGLPHAYLSGINVELMANSDNVFRGGLTSKHVDVKALMDHLDFNPVDPDILQGIPEGNFHSHYPTPVREFDLFAINATAGETIEIGPFPSLQVIIFLGGKATLAPADESLGKGSIIYLKPDRSLLINVEEDILGFRAGVPAT